MSFTSDFGTVDGYDAACRGVIATICPDARIVDVSHEIAPGAIRQGAVTLARTVEYLPRSVHLAVVDPGVGSDRLAIALETPRGLLVGPDNGLLIPAADVLGGITFAVELTNLVWWRAPVPSATFHGRDVFAPVAARLAAGWPIIDAGTELDSEQLVRLPAPISRRTVTGHEAEILHVDRFGNLSLAATPADLSPLRVRSVNGHATSVGATFSAVPPGALVVYVNSIGSIGVAVRDGSAARTLAVAPGDLISLS